MVAICFRIGGDHPFAACLGPRAQRKGAVDYEHGADRRTERAAMFGRPALPHDERVQAAQRLDGDDLVEWRQARTLPA